jgi:hypothetical protein
VGMMIDDRDVVEVEFNSAHSLAPGKSFCTLSLRNLRNLRIKC